jgi:predicted phosphate transport protein (TIGR00153 family)
MRSSVRLRLTPRDTSFYDHFTAAGANLVAGARLLQDGLAAGADRAAMAHKMRDIEHANDEVTHATMRQLNGTFVTPFDREDIYRLASKLDDVLDHMEAAAELVVLYDVEDLPEETQQVVDVLVRASQVTSDALPGLRGMKNLEEYWIEVNRLENEADQLYRRTVARLFSGQYDALTAMKLKDIADELEAAADSLEDVADTVETIAVKES